MAIDTSSSERTARRREQALNFDRGCRLTCLTNAQLSEQLVAPQVLSRETVRRWRTGASPVPSWAMRALWRLLLRLDVPEQLVRAALDASFEPYFK